MADALPVGTICGDELPEVVGMVAVYQVGKFVDDDVFETFVRVACQFEVDRDIAAGGAGSPSRFHLPDGYF